MLIRSVTAHEFGPLAAQTLTFADGMTVVHGPNESAKSSWHAAVYAGLCGRRRGGGLTKADRLFEDRHRPWDRDGWLVSVQILLDDGRRVELRQDLAGRVDCRAIDLDLGTDLTPEIITDGTPDAARWLGLDRRSFAATASVAQAAMLAVLNEPAELQEFLQRAADTAGADTTAARALARLEEFQRERVGLDRAHATRPLHRAVMDEQEAAARLARAQASRHEYEEELLEVERLRLVAELAEREVRRHEAVLATATAARLRARADEAVDLDHRLGGAEPQTGVGDDALATAAASALAAWLESTQLAQPPGAVAVAATTGPNSSTVDTEPWPPRRESVPRRSVTDPAGTALPPAVTAPPPFAVEPGSLPAGAPPHAYPGSAAGHGPSTGTGGGPDPAAVTAPGPAARLGTGDGGAGLSDGELWELARRLELQRPPRDPEVLDRFHVVRARLAELERRRTRGAWLGAGGVVVLLVAIAVAVLGLPALALVGFVVAAGALGGGLVLSRAGALELARAELAEAELSHAAAEQVAHDTLRQRRAAEARCAELGLPLDPVALRELARASGGGRRDQEWQDTLADQRHRAGERLLGVAHDCQLPAATPVEAAARLEHWLRERGERAVRADQDRRLWARLVALLDGRGLDALRTEAADAAHHADAARAGFSDDELAAAATADDDQVRSLRSAAQQASARADEARGSLAERARTLAGVPEAEEELARAQAELARVRELNEILDLTKTFLSSAQERAHRDIAPVLAASVRRALPRVTQGRYTDVIVDPRTLTVQVCGEQRRWRPADRLSHGTAEQVYLLLRLALADHLVRPGTVCPLLLDDVTVHADVGRVPALLELLREAAGHRQIVLFTQQDQVADWAREHLTGARHALHELPPVSEV